jgi:hypothetical protein
MLAEITTLVFVLVFALFPELDTVAVDVGLNTELLLAVISIAATAPLHPNATRNTSIAIPNGFFIFSPPFKVIHLTIFNMLLL